MSIPSTGTQQVDDIRRDDRDPVTAGIIAAAIEVHKALGPGLLESVYEECLCHELTLRNVPHQRQICIPIIYKGLEVSTANYRLDILVDKEVVLELKAVEQVLRVHRAQVLSYLRLTGKSKGLLINFNVPVLTEGITRVVL